MGSEQRTASDTGEENPRQETILPHVPLPMVSMLLPAPGNVEGPAPAVLSQPLQPGEPVASLNAPDATAAATATSNGSDGRRSLSGLALALTSPSRHYAATAFADRSPMRTGSLKTGELGGGRQRESGKSEASAARCTSEGGGLAWMVPADEVY